MGWARRVRCGTSPGSSPPPHATGPDPRDHGPMPDYGHRLAFGTFVTPSAAEPSHTVGLARVSEDVGLDLVTFQDHPYQPAFLDTWTLLAYVGARTERVTLSPNVLNLPLRPPAVVARAAASLDLLTGGRVALGLGAGAFWDAIEAMGGTRLSPGEAVDALGEAIDVIRGLWDTSSRSILRAGGEHHRVDGAKRGPAPAHPIPIWVGAYRPRMLRLIGERADGWLPSLGRTTTEDLGRATAVIDEAATASGRRPEDVRRVLNVGRLPAGEEAVDLLVELSERFGFSVFVVDGDDEREIERFAEVASEVRSIVGR